MMVIQLSFMIHWLTVGILVNLPYRTGAISYQCVALSVTGDPTGAYYVWSYAYPGELCNDFPKVGVWTDGYHMTFNQFSSCERSGFLVGLGILTQDRKKLWQVIQPQLLQSISILDQLTGIRVGRFPATLTVL
ncbi:MAG: hypothetical protein WKF71_06235 [Pyrinomonadaceae bacterium]